MVKIILDICDPEQLFRDLADHMQVGVVINFDWLNRTANGWPTLTIWGAEDDVRKLFHNVYGEDESMEDFVV
jgi:hypothetical protein